MENYGVTVALEKHNQTAFSWDFTTEDDAHLFMDIAILNEIKRGNTIVEAYAGETEFGDGSRIIIYYVQD